jgi:hypothetical protein
MSGAARTPIGSGDPVDYVYRVGRVYKRGPAPAATRLCAGSP